VLDWTALGQGGPRPVAGDQRITLAPWESVSRLRARLGQIAFCEWRNGGVAPSPPSSNACQNPELARMALGVAAENKMIVDREIVLTLRMTGIGVEPAQANPAALVDLAAELNVDAEGRLADCRFLGAQVRSGAPQGPDCKRIFAGPYIPATDRGGRPVPSRHRAELRVEVK
jgi:hypothetical protein